MTDISMVELPEQRTAVARATVPIEELRPFFDGVFGKVVAAVQGAGAHVTGPPFAMYFGMPGETVDVAAGFPVSGSFAETEGITASVLPGGRTVKAVHTGPYEGLPDTYREMAAWMGAQGLAPESSMWEVYLTDPSAETDPATWRTEVYWPAREAAAD